MIVNTKARLGFIMLAWLLVGHSYAEESSAPLDQSGIEAVIADDDVINLDGVQIRGNKELPQILYIVPWQEVETIRRVQEHDITLHSLSERRIAPVMPTLDEGGPELQ